MSTSKYELRLAVLNFLKGYLASIVLNL